MSKLKIISVAVLIFCLGILPKAQAYNQYFTHQLAIVYFAGQHPAGYTIEGYGPHPSPEYSFISNFLEGLENENPSLARYMIPRGFSYDSEFTDLKGSSSDDSFRFVKKEIDELVYGCPFNQTIQNQSSSDGQSTVLMSRKTEYYLRDTCVSKHVAVLQKLGFSKFNLEEGATAGWASFALSNNTPQDMAPLREQLLNIPGIEFLAVALQASPLSQFREIPNDQSHVRPGLYFDHSHWGSTHDPITLKFVRGWGDCMAGCMNSHTWDVTATPSAGANGRTIFAYVIKESGSPLVNE